MGALFIPIPEFGPPNKSNIIRQEMNPLIAKIINSEQLSDGQLFTEENRYYTFLNPVSYLVARENPGCFMEMDGIFADGGLLASAINRKYGTSITRRSFDMTSLAARLLSYAVENRKSLYIVGGTHRDNRIATDKLREAYPGILIAGCHHGYFNDNQLSEVIEDITVKNPDFVIAGMGACRQENFLQRLKTAGFKGTGFTCGGFISQLAKSGGSYYPNWIDKLGLRFIYRFIKEPHTRKRYCKALFLFPLKFWRDAD